MESIRKNISNTVWAQAAGLSCRLNRSYRVSAVVLAVFFGLMIPIGRFFRNGNDYGIFSDGAQISKTVFLVLGYACLFFLLILYAFALLKTAGPRCRSIDRNDRIRQFVLQHSILLFVVLFTFTLGIFVVFYPGFLMGDTASEIYESCGLDASYYYGTVPYLYPDSKLTNMHPIAVTFTIKACLAIGRRLFGSYNSGLGLAAVGQFALLLAVLVRSCKVLAKLGVKGKIILAYILFLYLNVLVFNYMYVITKDVIYLAFFFLCVVEVFLIATDRASKADFFLAAVSALGAAAFRGEGLYAVILLLAAGIVYLLRYHRKKRTVCLFGSFILGLVTIHLIWTGLVFPLLHVTPGLKTFQALIPMQQIARYVVNAETHLTEDEASKISAVIDIEQMKEVYDPTDADAVKNIFRHNCTDEEFKDFLLVWIKLCFKNPKMAFAAWLNNKYEYFYLEDTLMRLYTVDWSQHMMDDINSRIANETGHSLNLHYPESVTLREVRYRMESDAWTFRQLPVFRVLMIPAAYVLALLVVTIFFITERCAVGNILLWPLHFIFIVTNLCSGANASYGRYLYPIIVMLPFVLFAGIGEHVSSKAKEKTGNMPCI